MMSFPKVGFSPTSYFWIFLRWSRRCLVCTFELIGQNFMYTIVPMFRPDKRINWQLFNLHSFTIQVGCDNSSSAILIWSLPTRRSRRSSLTSLAPDLCLWASKKATETASKISWRDKAPQMGLRIKARLPTSNPNLPMPRGYTRLDSRWEVFNRVCIYSCRR